MPLTALVLAILLLMATHAQAHDIYHNWVNGLNQGCCNDKDCGPLKDKDESTIDGALHVRVEGQW